MSTVTVQCLASAANPFVVNAVGASGVLWTYFTTADFGVALQVSGGGYAQANPNGQRQDIEFTDPGTIPVGAVINSVTVHTRHRIVAGASTVGVRFVLGDGAAFFASLVQPYDQNPVGILYSNLNSAGFIEYTRVMATDLMRGIPWTLANIFNTAYGPELAVNPGDGTLWEVDQHYLVIDYTVPTPPVPRRTQDGSLALPTFDIDAMASGDPDRMAVAMRDGMTALTRTLQQMSNLLSRALIDVRWVAQPYSGLLYTVESPDGGVWTVQAADQIEFDYIRLGDMLFIQLVLDATSTLAGKTYTSLYVQIPGGYRTQGGVLHSAPVGVITPGAVAEEVCLVEANGQGAGQPVDKLRIRRLPIGTNVPAGLANTMALRLAILFRIVPPPTAK